MKGLITYENQRRIDEYMFSRTGFRELLYNSLQHKLYNSGNPIQISIYDDKLYIFNTGELPENLKNDLYAKHYSTPFNPRIAQVFFKAGFTESWGRGFTKIQEACEKYECPLPELYMNKGGTMILCNASERYKKLLNNINAQTTPKDRPNIAQTNSILENILILIEDNKYITQNDMAKILGVSRDVIKRNIKKLKDNKKLERNGSKNNGFWIIKK